MSKRFLSYFISFQNATICIVFSAYSSNVVGNTLADLLQQPDQFADFTALADLNKSNNNFIAVCVFLAWVKLFKYISFNKTMTQLSSTLSRVSIDKYNFYFMSEDFYHTSSIFLGLDHIFSHN